MQTRLTSHLFRLGQRKVFDLRAFERVICNLTVFFVAGILDQGCRVLVRKVHEGKWQSR